MCIHTVDSQFVCAFVRLHVREKSDCGHYVCLHVCTAQCIALLVVCALYMDDRNVCKRACKREKLEFVIVVLV